MLIHSQAHVLFPMGLTVITDVYQDEDGLYVLRGTGCYCVRPANYSAFDYTVI